MRLIQAVIPEGKKDEIVDLLTEKGIDYVISPETSQRKYSDVLFFPIPKEGVEEILDELRNSGLEENGFTIVTKAEAIVAREFEELKERYRESEEVDETKVARQELKASAENLSPSSPTYYLLLLAASIIASAGILLDNAAIVVGSMVIAPLIGPAMASCVGTIINDQPLFYSGVKKQLLGVLLAVVSSIAFSRLALSVMLPANLDLLSLSQVTHQINPGFLSLVVALGSGLAGAFSLTAGINSALVGVMISVALLPPAAAVGIGIATVSLEIAASASIILLINLVSINLAGTFTLWFQGYKPGRWYEQKGAEKATRSRIFVLLVLVTVIAVFLGTMTWEVRRKGHRVAKLRELTQTAMTDAGVELTEFTVEKTGLFFQKIVGVSAEYSAETFKEGLASAVDERLENYLGRSLNLNLGYKRVATG
ncbi:TIGR00341 family protein [Candidatus Bipolaricaulota bacterium]|nr:TIGR00341 family protein [Candidatus Bipolaricaulota bacterium]